MKSSELYIISFKGNVEGSHEFGWRLEQGFFAEFELSDIDDADIAVVLLMVKHRDFVELKFRLEGWAEVSCDRCLDAVRLPLKATAQLYVKFGAPDQASEDDSEGNDLVVVPFGTDQLDVAPFLYEYAHLNLPIRRVHPDDADGHSACNADMLRRLSELSVNS